MSCRAILPARGLAFLAVGQHKIHGLISEGKAISASILCPVQDLLWCSARRTTPSMPTSSASPIVANYFPANREEHEQGISVHYSGSLWIYYMIFSPLASGIHFN
jgi:hypothetical protein